MSIMKDEILGSRDTTCIAFKSNYDSLKDNLKPITNSGIKHIEIVARGSSKNACEYFKYLLENNSDYRVSFVYPSTITKYHGTLNKDTIYFAVSQGGRGEDLRLVIEEANRIGAITIALTNDRKSPLSNIAKHNFFMDVGKELSLAATKTYSAECMVLGMIAYALINKSINDFELSNQGIDYIDIESVKKTADKLSKIKNLFVLSRGVNLANGKEVCCKLQETCFINANYFSVSDFMHGPFALVDSSFNGLVLIPNDETKEDVINMIEKIKNNGGKLIIIGDYKDADINIKNMSNENYFFAMIYAIQLLACFTSELLGNNPDTSRNLEKYTKTI